MCTLWCIWMQHGGGENKQCLNFANCMHTWLQTTELRQGSSRSGSSSVEAQQLLCAVLVCSWCEVKYITFKILFGYTGWCVLLCSGPVAHNRHASHQLWLAANTALHVSVGSLLLDAGGCPIPGAGKPHRADQQGCAQHPYSDFSLHRCNIWVEGFHCPQSEQTRFTSILSFLHPPDFPSPPRWGQPHRLTESWAYTGAFPPLVVLLFSVKSELCQWHFPDVSQWSCWKITAPARQVQQDSEAGCLNAKLAASAPGAVERALL